MNVIVSNKQKNLLDNANIDAIKDLNGLFNVDELINNFKDYFFSRMIIDATSIVDFASESVVRKLVNGIGAEKIILLLPPKPEPPRKFCELLISLGLYNFTTTIDDVLKYLKTPNTLENAQKMLGTVDDTTYETSNEQIHDFNNYVGNSETILDNNRDNKIVIGFKNVTLHAGSTTLIYMLKKELESTYNIACDAVEVGNSDFNFFNTKGMTSVNQNSVEAFVKNSSSKIVLIDLNNNSYDTLCDDVIYLVEPSIIKINKLLYIKRDAFKVLKDKKVILNKCMLTSDDINIFSKEADINIYYSVPFVNDRVENKVIKDLIEHMGITGGAKGFLGLFK